MTDTKPNGWARVLRNLRQPKVLVMLLLGFSSGIPLYLVDSSMAFSRIQKPSVLPTR